MVHKHYPNWPNGPTSQCQRRRDPQKRNAAAAAGPPSSAFTELSDVCKEEMSPGPRLSLPPLGNSGAPRTVQGSQRTPTVHTTVLLLSPGWSLLLRPQELRWCSVPTTGDSFLTMSSLWALRMVALLPISKSTPCWNKGTHFRKIAQYTKGTCKLDINCKGGESRLL